MAFHKSAVLYSVNHLVTTCFITYRIKMIDFKGMLFLMLNPLKIFSWLFFPQLLLKYTDEMMPLSHAGREATLWPPVIIIIRLPPKLWAEELDIFVVLSQSPVGRNMPKMTLTICEIYCESLTVFSAMHYCLVPISSTRGNSDVFSTSLGKNDKML